LQSGPIPGYVRGMLKQLAARGDSVRPGDVIMHNDPYGGASHGPDVGFCVPVFYDGQLVGFSVTTAHHLDIGSQTPGSTGIVEAACAELFDYSERLMRQAIEHIPDGRYTATGYMDGYLDDPSPSRRNLPIVVTLTVKGSDMVVDLTGTAPQVADRPINMPFVGTVDVAVSLVLGSVLLDTETYGNIPQNSGLYRPITIVTPEGTLANPIFPAHTIAHL